ncbi:major facilitator superfamily domain-containing protein [Lipomyces arxii]|uniref:major facilitator superfamily domain-containing protein n=1 Tax=Lipomyces arxii TaxID=56418 RepID=UPI0034CE6E86
MVSVKGFLARLTEAIGWYPKEMPMAERVLVHKIDLLVLGFACLAFFTKFLDVNALTYAYVSGMKEDLNLYGNRLNYINAMYEVGYCIFQIPSNIIITRIPAQYYLPGAEILWGLFTLGTAFVQNYKQIMALRFMVGLGATASYVGCTHIVNSWYRKRELGRRNAIFYISMPLGTMIAGYIQSAAYEHLNHRSGLAGWRWLFIICAIITLPIAALGVIFFPDVPERTKSRWLTDAEKKLAVTRLAEEGFKPSTGINRTLFKRVFGRWQFYVFVYLLVFRGLGQHGSGVPFTLWLKSQPDKYTVPQVNNFSTITSAISIVSAVLTAYYSDLRGSRWEVQILGGVITLFADLCLTIWNIPYGLKFASYILLGLATGFSPTLIAWTADQLADDLEARAITIATYNVVGEMSNLVVPLVAWPVTHAPEFKGGFIWSTCVAGVWTLSLGVPLLLERRDRQRKARGFKDDLGGIEMYPGADELEGVEELGSVDSLTKSNDFTEVTEEKHT